MSLWGAGSGILGREQLGSHLIPSPPRMATGVGWPRAPPSLLPSQQQPSPPPPPLPTAISDGGHPHLYHAPLTPPSSPHSPPMPVQFLSECCSRDTDEPWWVGNPGAGQGWTWLCLPAPASRWARTFSSALNAFPGRSATRAPPLSTLPLDHRDIQGHGPPGAQGQGAGWEPPPSPHPQALVLSVQFGPMGAGSVGAV